MVKSLERSRITQRITKAALEAGASIVGVADLDIVKGLPSYDGLRLDTFRSAISYAVPLPGQAFELIHESDLF